MPPFRLEVPVATVLWGVAGVLSLAFGGYGMTQLVMGYHWLFFRSLLSDGQYFFFFVLTYPSGTAAALATVVALATRKTNPKMSIAACVIGGIATIMPALLYSGMIGMSAIVNPKMGLAILGGALLVFLPIYVIGGALIGVGIVRHRKLQSGPVS